MCSELACTQKLLDALSITCDLLVFLKPTHNLHCNAYVIVSISDALARGRGSAHSGGSKRFLRQRKRKRFNENERQ